MEETTRVPLKKLQGVQVQASETQNYNENYFLSNLDTPNFYMVNTIYCYKSDEKKSNKDVAGVLKDALSKVLVHYYPLAGSLMIGDDGKFVVKCTNKGAHFVEAEADCEIDVVGDITIPNPALGNLVCTFPEEALDSPLLSIQVTRFKCGGFVIGVSVSHMMVDGISGTEFVNSWAEIARGNPVTVQPYLDRRVLESRKPPLIKYPHDEFQKIDDISGIEDLYEKEKNVLETFTFNKEKISILKRRLMQEENIKSCTSLTILTATIWRARCKALKMKPNQIAKVLMVVDGSKDADSELPKGYFGNRVCHVSCACLASEVMEKPLSFAIERLQNCMKLGRWDYLKSVVDYTEVNKDEANMIPTATLYVNSWGRLPFHTTDFGWGEPYQTGMPGSVRKEGLYICPLGNDEGNGITAILTLPETAMESFKTLIEEDQILL